MKEYKIKVNNEAESREAQELFFALSYQWAGAGKVSQAIPHSADTLYTFNNFIQYGNSLQSRDEQEITLGD